MTTNKFRTLANRMQQDIDSKLNDRLTNTPKRQREAQSARHEVYRLQRTQAALRGLANLYEAGTVPELFKQFTSKKSIYEAMGAEIKSSGGYYDSGVETGEPRRTDEGSVKLWNLAQSRTTTDHKADALKVKIDNLQFAKIPGYFPTPDSVIELMAEKADIREGMSVLEPSAGSGEIIDCLGKNAQGIEVDCLEINFTLTDILRDKGYRVIGSDFLDWNITEPKCTYERILMNPPFEKMQDIEHLRKAYTHLKEGGRLVAIMSPGPFFRTNIKATEFLMWFDEVGGETEDLPQGSFKASGTGVNAKIVVIDKN